MGWLKERSVGEFLILIQLRFYASHLGAGRWKRILGHAVRHWVCWIRDELRLKCGIGVWDGVRGGWNVFVTPLGAPNPSISPHLQLIKNPTHLPETPFSHNPIVTDAIRDENQCPKFNQLAKIETNILHLRFSRKIPSRKRTSIQSPNKPEWISTFNSVLKFN